MKTHFPHISQIYSPNTRFQTILLSNLSFWANSGHSEFLISATQRRHWHVN